MQEQLQEAIMEARQTRQLQQDLSVCIAALEPRQDPQPVSHLPNTAFTYPPYEHQPHYSPSPFKMEVPRFDGTKALGWIFKF